MHKRIISIILLIIFTLSIVNCPIYASNMTINAKSYVLMEADTGKIIMENNPDMRLTPASITKIMTILLIYEALEQEKIKLTDIVTVSEHAASMGGSQVYLEPFEKQTVEDMLKCIVVASANDASVAMAEFIAGSEDAFVEMMNNKAIELGMVNTHFVNACGLDANNHYTSAKDVALVSRELITKYPDVHKYTQIWQDSIIHKTRKGEKEFVLTNTNKLIKWYESANGLKTGSTSKALYCLSGTAEKENLKFIAVIMAAPDFKIRFREAMKLFDYGFANFKMISGKTTDEKIGEIRVSGGKTRIADVYVKNNMKFLMNKNEKAEIESIININDKVSAPAKANSKVGEIVYKINSKEVGKADLVIKQELQKAGFKDSLSKILDEGYFGS